MSEERIKRLVAQFDGAIKYAPMLKDHPDWTDEQCLELARKGHELAVERLKAGDPLWNRSIPYCRNDPTKVKR